MNVYLLDRRPTTRILPPLPVQPPKRNTFVWGG